MVLESLLSFSTSTMALRVSNSFIDDSFLEEAPGAPCAYSFLTTAKSLWTWSTFKLMSSWWLLLSFYPNFVLHNVEVRNFLSIEGGQLRAFGSVVNHLFT